VTRVIRVTKEIRATKEIKETPAEYRMAELQAMS
jgi:hypothetical protein